MGLLRLFFLCFFELRFQLALAGGKICVLLGLLQLVFCLLELSFQLAALSFQGAALVGCKIGILLS